MNPPSVDFDMTQQDARAALRELGITNPSRGLIENWLRANEAEAELAQVGTAHREAHRRTQSDTEYASQPAEATERIEAPSPSSCRVCARVET